jgi:hypothetical protein
MTSNAILAHLAYKTCVIIIIGLILLFHVDAQENVLDASILSSPISSISTGGSGQKTRWPTGISLTKDEKKRIVRRVREAKMRAKKDGMPFDLTAEFIAELFLKQGGRCYFSKRLMTWEANTNDTVAINRIDPDAQYTKKNVVLCCLIVANFRNSYHYETTLKYSKAVLNHSTTISDSRLEKRRNDNSHLVKRQVSLNSNVTFGDAAIDSNIRGKSTRKPRIKDCVSRKEREEDRVFAAHFSLKRCTVCGKYLPLDEYAKRTPNNPGPDGLESQCRDCQRKRGLERSIGLENLLKQKVSHARTRSKKGGLFCNIDVSVVLDLLKKQEGLCYYSGISLTGEPGNLDNVSIDRIDSAQPYISGNIVLCCEAINTMKNEMDYPMFLQYCKAIVDNALPLDDPCLYQCQNESLGGKRREVALKRKSSLDGITITRHGISGFSAGFSG